MINHEADFDIESFVMFLSIRLTQPLRTYMLYSQTEIFYQTYKNV